MDDTQRNLLVSVITSYMPKEWKLKAVKTLVARGCDIDAKNKFGKTALDLAPYTKDIEIVKFLSVQ